MIQKKNLFLAGILISIPVLVLIIISLVKALSTSNVRFFYPDQKFQDMKLEKRNFTYNPENSYFEEKLIEEYFLGPINYKLVFPIDHENLLKDVVRVKTKKEVVLVINFQSGFSQYALQHIEKVEWLIKGVIKTLKENTRVKKVYILENNQKMKLHIGDWQLYYPIKII